MHCCTSGKEIPWGDLRDEAVSVAIRESILSGGYGQKRVCAWYRIVLARAIDRRKVVSGQMLGPVNEFTGLLLALCLRGTAQNLLQCVLICVEGERATQEVLLELLHSPETPQAFLFHCTVVTFGRRQHVGSQTAESIAIYS